jgi:glycosyltransferase involved in cell wall biosynthesis
MPGVTDVSVIVPAWRAAATLEATVDAIAGQDADVAWEAIVVYDPADPDTAVIVDRHPELRWVPRPAGIGAGAARNIGASEARGPILAFVDADCVPRADWLRRGLAAIDGADLVQGAVMPDPAAVRRPFDHTVAIGRESPLYETANLFVRKDLFEDLGGFEDWFEITDGRPFGEDVVFGWAARRLGARTGFADDARVEHEVVSRGAMDGIREAWRRGHFVALVEKVPELRDEFFYRKIFLSRRSAAFDLAMAGLLASAALRSRVLLAAGAPYLQFLVGDMLRWRRSGPRAALGELAADAVGMASLVRASVKYGRPVL